MLCVGLTNTCCSYVVKVIDSMRSPTLKVQEIRIMLHMDHRNVVKMVDFYSSGSNLCIVMEYCERGDMAQLIKRLKKEKEYVPEEKVWKAIA